MLHSTTIECREPEKEGKSSVSVVKGATRSFGSKSEPGKSSVSAIKGVTRAEKRKPTKVEGNLAEKIGSNKSTS